MLGAAVWLLAGALGSLSPAQAPAAPATVTILAPDTYRKDVAARTALAQQVSSLATSVLAQAKSDRDRQMALAAHRSAALVQSDWKTVVADTDALRKLESKPAMQQLEGVAFRAYAGAALDHGNPSASTFGQFLKAALDPLDGRLTAASLRVVRTRYFLMTPASLDAQLVGPISANIRARSGQADLALATQLLETLFLRERLLPLLPVLETAFADRLKRGDMAIVDRWTPRTVDLKGMRHAPVIVGIWDSGIDPSLFKGRLWVNAREPINGQDDDGNGFVDDRHGFAFDPDRKPTTGMLGERPGGDSESYERLARYSIGWADLDAGDVSADARFARSVSASLDPAERARFDTDLSRISLYTHGTGIASIAAAGNPSVKLMMGRLSYRINQVPAPIDEAGAEGRIANFTQAIAYFRDHGARIVNMSFRLTEPNVAASLAALEPNEDRRAKRAKAIYDSMHHTFAAAMAKSPNILFVAGAGNANENNDLVRSYPAGVGGANLITVGAIDSSLQPADITSLGKSVDVYALGVTVPQKLVGGRTIRFTGTSSATPQVTNLAAKLLALCPLLTPVQLKSLIVRTATVESSLKLRVINPREAVRTVRSANCRV